MKTDHRTTPIERMAEMSLDDDREHHRSLACNLIDDVSDADAWAIEMGCDGVIALLGDRARRQMAHDATRI